MYRFFATYKKIYVETITLFFTTIQIDEYKLQKLTFATTYFLNAPLLFA